MTRGARLLLLGASVVGCAAACGSSNGAPGAPDAGGGRQAGGEAGRGELDGGDSGGGAGGAFGEAGLSGAGEIGEAGATGHVHGVVIDFATARPLPDREVTIDGATTLTDALGGFDLTVRNAPFDVVIAEPDGASVSVYEGLRSSELALPHASSATSPPPAHSADIQGTLSGAGDYPLDSSEGASLHFLADRAANTLLVPSSFGPDYGPMSVFWDGPESITGKLVALRFSVDDEGTIHYQGAAVSELTLSDGEVTERDIDLAAPVEGRLTGTIRVPDGQSVSCPPGPSGAARARGSPCDHGRYGVFVLALRARRAPGRVRSALALGVDAERLHFHCPLERGLVDERWRPDHHGALRRRQQLRTTSHSLGNTHPLSGTSASSHASHCPTVSPQSAGNSMSLHCV